nr:hypothetical protein [Staphylococcus epidermidis]
MTYGKYDIPQNEDGTNWLSYNKKSHIIKHIENSIYSEPLRLNTLTKIIHSLRQQ